MLEIACIFGVWGLPAVRLSVWACRFGMRMLAFLDKAQYTSYTLKSHTSGLFVLGARPGEVEDSWDKEEATAKPGKISSPGLLGFGACVLRQLPVGNRLGV